MDGISMEDLLFPEILATVANDSGSAIEPRFFSQFHLQGIQNSMNIYSGIEFVHLRFDWRT